MPDHGSAGGRTPSRIGLTFDLAPAEPLTADGPDDAFAELDSEETIDDIAAALVAHGHEVVRIGGARALMAALCTRSLHVDLVFNVAEGVQGRAREAQVPALLEAVGVPYTGSDPVTMALTLDKSVAKRLWLSAGLPTPPFTVVARAQDLDDLAAPFPLFVKPVAEGSSMGIDAGALVHDRDALAKRVERVWRDYRQPALIEGFLPGREFTVGILGEGDGSRVLGVVETFSRGHLSGYAEKLATGLASSVREFRPLDERALERELADLALRAYRLVGCRDVGRVDLRCDGDGRPSLLELNPLPGLARGRSALPILARYAGSTYDALIGSILEAALARIARAGTTFDGPEGVDDGRDHDDV
jgi:D-alanine-D-alanine ligase